jgi:hypothetical protein
MNSPRPLERWDRGFRSHLRHECLYVRLLCVVLSCVQVATLRRADPPLKSLTDYVQD